VGSPEALTQATLSELVRRHKAAATTVGGLVVAVVLLSIVAFLGKSYLREQTNPSLDIGLRIAILGLGLGAIALRRTRFATMRLQDIGALQGASGLLITLERTTLQLAVLGAVIAALGFVGTLMTGNDRYTYWAGLIAIVVLLYCYPSRKAWSRTLQMFVPAPDPAAST
jgi:hypothetical protein